MATRLKCQAMLEELSRLTYSPGGKPIPLEDKHVEHLSIDTKTLAERHRSLPLIIIGLPPLICKNRYHEAWIYFYPKGAYIEYRGAASVQYAIPKSEPTRYIRKKGVHYMEEAIRYAGNHWGDKLRDPTLTTAFSRSVEGEKLWIFSWPNKVIYQTTSLCEALEIRYNWDGDRS